MESLSAYNFICVIVLVILLLNWKVIRMRDPGKRDFFYELILSMIGFLLFFIFFIEGTEKDLHSEVDLY